MLDKLLNTNDPNEKWPTEEMIRALGLPVRLRSFIKYHQDKPTKPISLQELFDWVISDDDDPRPGDLISPMLDYRNIGMKGFRETVAILNAAAFQPNIKEIWELKHQKMLRSLRVIGFSTHAWSKPLNWAGSFYSCTRIEMLKKKEQADSSPAPSPSKRRSKKNREARIHLLVPGYSHKPLPEHQ